jgi:hypothetical protein
MRGYTNFGVVAGLCKSHGKRPGMESCCDHGKTICTKAHVSDLACITVVALVGMYGRTCMNGVWALLTTDVAISLLLRDGYNNATFMVIETVQESSRHCASTMHRSRVHSSSLPHALYGYAAAQTARTEATLCTLLLWRHKERDGRQGRGRREGCFLPAANHD